MLRIPGAKKAKRKVRRYAEKEFEFALRMYGVWMTMSKRPRQAKTWQHVFDLVMMLNVQACRLYRSIVKECAAAEGFTANILSRSLFETVLAVAFVLNKTVRVQVQPKLDGNNKHVPDKDGVLPYRITAAKPKKRTTRNLGTQYKPKRRKTAYPSTELRARLYLAHGIFADQKRYADMSKLKGIKRSMKRMAKTVDAATVAAAETAIGPGWTYVLRNSDNYSGLGIAQLAEVAGPHLERWYRTVYGMQCKLVHAADAPRHSKYVGGQIRPRYFSEAPEVDSVLHGATAMVLMVMKQCDKAFDLHPVDSMMIDGLFREFSKFEV